MKNKAYKEFLAHIKQQITTSQYHAIQSVNRHLLWLYWNIGTAILQKQETQGWGAKIIEQLSSDIQKSFPDVKGFSARNLTYMRAFAQAYPFIPIVQPVVAQLEQFADKPQKISHHKKKTFRKTPLVISQPLVAKLASNPELVEVLFTQIDILKISWAHHFTLLNKVKDSQQRQWYISQSIANGWSRNVLLHMVETNLYKRQVKNKKSNNFSVTLPKPQSDLAQQLLKDPYIFDFITVSEKANERNIEDQLCEHVTKFLLELGQGFAFVGRQYKMMVGKKEYAPDLLFYNIKLHCYVVVELKARDFEPGDAGKLNFYLNVVNDKLRTKDENSTIGLLLCKGKNKVIADYALAGIQQPMGVADYQLTKAIPKNLKSALPSIADIERELSEME